MLLTLADQQKKKHAKGKGNPCRQGGERGERRGIKGGTDGGEGARRRKEEVVKVLAISENPFRRNLKQIDFSLGQRLREEGWGYFRLAADFHVFFSFSI